ncbi:MAG: hypothetical protein NZ522_06575 [Chitinophagales bacterium]|nr:hypothetical protein [Chitinophagales bacterium]
MEFFSGRTLLIATKHGKEMAIAPLMERALRVKCVVAKDFDSDVFGTFSGEVPRENSPLETARNKCMAAMKQEGADLCIASEGSFGPHPLIPFAYCDEEWLLMKDMLHGLEFSHCEISSETNFDAREIVSERDLKEFAKKVRFPEHALILRPGEKNYNDMAKGVQSESMLLSVFRSIISKYGTCYVETDMRAHLNPTRMKVIARATEQLVLKLQKLCPVCGTPGFGVTRVNPGLPCELCGNPTASTLSYTLFCQKCKHEQTQLYPRGKQTEEARFCNWCNP